MLCGSLLLGALLALGACAKSGGDNGGGGGQIAQTPCNAPQGGSCNPGVYSQNPGLQIPAPQAYTAGYSGGYCGCSSGYRPIYNPQWGFACAPANTFTYENYVGYSYQSIYQSQNNSGLNAQQIYYSPLQYGGQGSCFSDFALSCDVRIANSCTNGGQCRAIGGGSSIGVCTSGVGVDSYNTGTTNINYPGYYGNDGYYGNGGYYGGGYYGYGGNYNSGNCRYRTNSWGLSYYYCAPGVGGTTSDGVAR